MLFCDHQHLVRSGHEGSEACRRMREDLAHTEALRDCGPPWRDLTTRAIDCGKQTVCTALEALGCHDLPGACLACWRNQAASAESPPPPWLAGALATADQDLPDLRCAPLRNPGRAWPWLYAQLGLPSDSPAAVFADWAATLALAIVLASDSGWLGPVGDAPTLVVHVPGGAREARTAWLAQLCAALLPWPVAALEVHFVDPQAAEASAEWESLGSSGGRRIVQTRSHASLYHEVAPRLPSPDLVFLPNAGLAVGSTWHPTLE